MPQDTVAPGPASSWPSCLGLLGPGWQPICEAGEGQPPRRLGSDGRPNPVMANAGVGRYGVEEHYDGVVD
jgi:hypothetical protein